MIKKTSTKGKCVVTWIFDETLLQFVGTSYINNDDRKVIITLPMKTIEVIKKETSDNLIAADEKRAISIKTNKIGQTRIVGLENWGIKIDL